MGYFFILDIISGFKQFLVFFFFEKMKFRLNHRCTFKSKGKL